MKKLLDLKLFGLVAILTVVLVFIGVDFMEGQVQTLAKPDKPGKPDNPKADQITFSGNLEGDAAVYGCCPNAGPFPEYTMKLAKPVGYIPADTYEGKLFINGYGAGRDHRYIVQFWTDWFGIEIIGGIVHSDKKTKVLTVTFTDEPCWDMNMGEYFEETLLSFELVRYTIRNQE